MFIAAKNLFKSYHSENMNIYRTRFLYGNIKPSTMFEVLLRATQMQTNKNVVG